MRCEFALKINLNIMWLGWNRRDDQGVYFQELEEVIVAVSLDEIAAIQSIILELYTV